MTGAYLSTAYYHCFTGTVAPLSPQIKQLIFFVCTIFMFCGLPRSDNSIFCHISVGACSEPVSLILPVTIYGFSYIRILLNRTDFQTNGNIHFYILKGLDPYIHKFVRYFYHSHHRYFIDPRRVTYSRYLYLPFHSILLSVWVYFRRLHRAYEHLAFDKSRSEYQGRRFKALPSHSTYRIISSPNQNCTFLY